MDYAGFLEEADQVHAAAIDVYGRRSRTAKAFADAYKVAEREKQMFEEDARPEDTAAGNPATTTHT